MQLLGAVHQVIGIDQVSAELRKFTLLISREALIKFLAGHQLQDGIAKKFQLFVVLGSFRTLARERAVSQRLLQQSAICELVAERAFEIVQRKMLHRKNLRKR